MRGRPAPDAMPAEIVVLPSPAAVAEALADRTATALRATLAGEPRATLCLTGGSTPPPAYERLARADVDWDRVHVFWGDERCVPPDHADSNYAMARRTLLDPAGVPDSNVHRMPGECPPDEGAVVYEQALEQFFGAELRLDVVHLGMGSDGHLASLFPGSRALAETGRRVVPTTAPEGMASPDRLTLTFPVLEGARLCLVAAHGTGKRDAFGAVLDAYDGEGEGPPIARLDPEGSLVWLVDRALSQGVLDDD